MIKLVSFDLDGTIADTLPVCIAAFKKAVTPYISHSISKEDVENTFGVNEEGMIKQIVSENWEDALRDFCSVYENMLSECPPPFDGLIELIKELKDRNVIVTLITGKGDECCYSTLRHFGIEKYFDNIQTGSTIKIRKAEAMTEQLNIFGLKPEEMIYIGDAPSDVTECRKVGVKCISAAWASTAKPQTLEALNSGNVYYDIESLHKALII